MNWLDEVKTTLLPLAKNASQAVMQIYASDNFGVDIKSDNSPLTKADTLSHQIICSQLEKYGFPVISEESCENTALKNDCDTFWLVDPLDGTKEFINKNGEFTINIALIENSRPTLGIVAAPALNKYYYAVKGHGAYKVEKESHQKISCSNVTDITKATIAVSRSHLNAKDEEFIKENNITKIKKLGSALKYCEIAEGIVDLSIRYTPLMQWDIAASDILLAESGASALSINYSASFTGIDEILFVSNNKFRLTCEI